MQVIEKIRLKNGFVLELIDRSRRLAGDRWLVSVEARIEVPIDKKYLSGVSDTENIISVLKKKYKENVEYSYVQEKHFVDERENEKIRNQFLKNIKENLLHYLSHPEFGSKILLAKYQEIKRKFPWLLSQ